MRRPCVCPCAGFASSPAQALHACLQRQLGRGLKVIHPQEHHHPPSAQARTRTQYHVNARACKHACTRLHTCTHKHAHTHARAGSHVHLHGHAHKHIHAHTQVALRRLGKASTAAWDTTLQGWQEGHQRQRASARQAIHALQAVAADVQGRLHAEEQEHQVTRQQVRVCMCVREYVYMRSCHACLMLSARAGSTTQHPLLSCTCRVHKTHRTCRHGACRAELGHMTLG